MAWWALHLSYTWDGSPPHIECVQIRKFDNVAEARTATFDMACAYFQEECDAIVVDAAECKRVAQDEHRALWKWEWQRKGNGDLFVAFEAPETEEETVTLLHRIDESGLRDDAHVFDTEYDWSCGSP